MPKRLVYIQKIVLSIIILGLLLFGTLDIFVAAYFSIFLFIAISTAVSQLKIFVKIGMIFTSLVILVLQGIITETLFPNTENITVFTLFFHRALSVIILWLQPIIAKILFISIQSRFHFSSFKETPIISFSELKVNSQKIKEKVSELQNIKKSFSFENIKEIIDDLPRHSSFKYINDGTLSEEYFIEAENSLDDPFIYIIVSKTGSAASEVISVFTKQEYNHASISFDRDLKTIISYNGGEKIFPPGLNHEMVEFFSKKGDSSIIVYSLSCTREQKQNIIEKIRKINEEGSAYNMLGLIFKYSHKPNIMFCSQFVYNVLEKGGLSYFESKGASVTPSDLVEQDYYKKLNFEYEIHLGSHS